MKNLNYLLLSIFLFSSFCFAEDLSKNSFVGKTWSELPKSKYGGFVLPLPWKGTRKLSLRYYEIESGKHVVTIVENKDLKDANQDLVIAALDLRKLTSDDGKIVISATNDCELKGNSNKESVVIGIIKQDRSKTVGKYKPSRAWILENSTMKFKEIPASKVKCEPQSYES